MLQLEGQHSGQAKMFDGAQPLFVFGVIADVQYANVENGCNYLKTRRRYYRNSVTLLHDAVERWNGIAPHFIVQLGDLIDGLNKKHNFSAKALEIVMKEFQRCKTKIHHVWGNHEFYNFTREYLMSSILNSKALESALDDISLNTEDHAAEAAIYSYHFSPAPSFRFVLLDAYDLSVLGRKAPSKKYNQSLKILQDKNKNQNLNCPPEGQCGTEQRFVQFNGGFSKEQLSWLDKILTYADKNLEKVTIISHLPVHPDSTDPICLAWNYEEMLSVLHSHKSVVCFMAGHDHDGGYHMDHRGIHHVTMEGVIETPPDTNAFATVYVHQDGMILKGVGRVSDRIMLYPST
ncbi:manganese-dependent ADP-ribose/CDP-alcohol diphosphatase [Polypterus senegalus]|uniref:manganese-dependent ADP-ribose/CDP-alcohol diphosphatase n=1 Tax=Polypterus senegalus TaxID=55291 RepID=UPI0019659BD2|nr:manganese-dependent ADP-ribose/CDP-alcohol diphosphatase [Polypterus senegalus]